MKVVAKFSDHGDGGWDVTLYKNWDELLDDDYKVQDGEISRKTMRKYLENDEDILEYGSAKEFNIPIDVNGELAESISMSFGQ